MKKIWSTWVEIRKIKYFNTKINLIPIELRVAINRWRQLPDRCRSFWNISQSFFHRRIKPGHSDKSTFEYRYERVRHAAAIDRPTGGGEAHNLSTFYTKRCNKNHLRESKAIYQAILSVNYYNFCRGVWRSHNIKKKTPMHHAMAPCDMPAPRFVCRLYVGFRFLGSWCNEGILYCRCERTKSIVEHQIFRYQ